MTHLPIFIGLTRRVEPPWKEPSFREIGLSHKIAVKSCAGQRLIGEAWTKCYDLKDKTNAETDYLKATARKPVGEYQLARLGSPGPSGSHIGRRGAPDRISAVDYWRNRMARGKPRRTDDPSSLRCAAEAQAHPPAVSRRERGAHAGVRPALVANDRRSMARCCAPAVSFQSIGSH